MVKMSAKRELSLRAKNMGDRGEMATGATWKSAEAETTPEAAQPLGDIDT